MTGEKRETRIIAFCNLLLGIAVMLGSLAYYMNFTPINVGGVFYLFFVSLFILLLLGWISLLFWKNERLGKYSNEILSALSKPGWAVGITVIILIGWISSNMFSTRYPFLGTGALNTGWILLLYSFVIFAWHSFLLQVVEWVNSIHSRLKIYWHYVDQHWVMILLLGGITFFTFRNSYTGALLRLDDLIMIDYARNESLLAAITSPPDVYSVFYRPMHNLVLWIYYQLFGFDYALYQFAELLGHFVTVTLFYWLAFVISREKIFALIAATLFGTHIYVSVGVVYVNAVFWWLGVFGVLAQLVIAKSRRMRGFALFGLSVLLLLNLLLGEYGFALVGAQCLMALYLFLTSRQDRSSAMAIFLSAVFVTLVYFGMRWQAVGLLPESGGGSSGYFWDFYSNPRVLGINHYIYTVGANFVSTFVPIFSQVGVLMFPPIMQVLFGVTIYSIYILGIRKTPDNSINSFLWLPILYIYLMGSKEIVKHWIGNYNLSLTFSLHTMLNFSIAFLILNWRKISKEHKRIIVYAIGMLLSGCIVAFAYFRWRTHYYTHMAWILLVVVGMCYLKNARAGKAIITSLILISVLLSWKSMKIIDSRLPAIKIEQFQHNLCDPRVSKDLSLDMIEYYGIDDETVLSCVAEK